jgi:hypothetical protein
MSTQISEVLQVTIEWFRDLVIIIYGLVGAVFLVYIGIMALSLFRRLEFIMDSLKVTSSNIQEISTVAREQMVKPIMQVGSVFQGITRWIEMISGYFKKSKKEVNDE